MAKVALIKDAQYAWNQLQGIICVYKPLGISLAAVIKDIKYRLCRDLNDMECREPQTVVQFRRLTGEGQTVPKLNAKKNALTKIPTLETENPVREIIARINDGPDVIEVVKGPSYADHPLVVGPRYQPHDFKLAPGSSLGRDSSGVSVLGITREGIRISRRIFESKWVKTYVVSGRFGIVTDNQFHTGKIVGKSTYHNIKRQYLDRLLLSSQASHQRAMFQSAGVLLNSERAYELASQGLIRPEGTGNPVVYSLKCVKFDLPDFEIEIQVVNEEEQYLKTLIHEFGLRLKSLAVCTKIRCIKYGPFTLEHALLRKHWDVENLILSISESAKLLKGVDLWTRDPLVNETVGVNTKASISKESIA